MKHPSRCAEEASAAQMAECKQHAKEKKSAYLKQGQGAKTSDTQVGIRIISGV